MKLADRGARWITRLGPIVLIGAAVAVAIWRLQYGVDFTDEAFYVVLPLRFLAGAKPYVDEISVTQQTAALLSVPYVWAYRAIAGLTGIVLAVRVAALVLAILAAAAVGSSARALAGRTAGAVAAASVIAYVPFDIRSLSYNSYAALSFAAGCFLAVAPKPRRLLAGLAHAVTAFAYPPLAVIVLVLAVTRLARGGRAWLAYAIPALALPGIAAAILVADAGPHRVLSDFRISSRDLGQGGGLAKLRDIGANLGAALHNWPLLVALLAALAIVWIRKRVLAALLLPLLPLAAMARGFGDYAASLEWAAVFGMLALPVGLLVRRHAAVRPLLLWVWLPSLGAGLTTAYSSANGEVNFGVGFFAAALVAIVFVVIAAGEATKSMVGRTLSLAATSASIVGLLLVLLLPVYRDASLSHLTTRITSGSFAGLRSTPRKASFVGYLQRRLAPLSPACRVFFFDDFPGGYLLSQATAETNGAWTAGVSPRHTAAYTAAEVAYLRRHGLPDIIVWMTRVPYDPPISMRIERYPPDDSLVSLTKSRAYERVSVSRDALVYQRRRTTCGLRQPARAELSGLLTNDEHGHR